MLQHSRFLFWIGIACCAVWSPSLTAHAADDARTHFMRGQTAYQQGDYELAIREWSAAYKLDPRPLLQYNLSQAHERLGKLKDAAAALDKYLASADPDDPHQPDARARKASIQERLRRTGIQITGGPEGAEIFVDDQPWGRAPRPDLIQAEPGSHRVVLKLQGYKDFNSLVVVPEGQPVEVPVQMEALSDEGAEDVQRFEASSTTAGTPRSVKKGDSILPWLLIGGGALAVGVGGLLGVFALNSADKAESSDSVKADSAKTLALGADACFGAGIVAAGVGLILLLSEDDAHEKTQAQAGTQAGTWRMFAQGDTRAALAGATLTF